jgi:hypothetical protein
MWVTRPEARGAGLRGWEVGWVDRVVVGPTKGRGEKYGNKSLYVGGATYATYKSSHFKPMLFGFTGDLFCTFCTLSHPTYVNQTPYAREGTEDVDV